MTDWHAIRTHPRAEGDAAIGLAALGLPTYLPVELVRKHFRDCHETGWRPLFPRYLFAQFDAGRDLVFVLEVEGVAGILRDGSRLAPIGDGVIEAIRHAESRGVFDRGANTRLRHGDEVSLLGSPFADLVARISTARPKKRLELVGNFPFRIVTTVDKARKISA